ncbi:MAG: cytochrome c [Deltaproteobacteria bacterium]|nr:cytochrome c [Deltaproteobacteria bacterium]
MVNLRAFSLIIFFVLYSLLIPTDSWAAVKFVSAKENYVFYCVSCHGPKGLGDGINATKTQPVTPRNHTDAIKMERISDEELLSVIKDGGRALGKSTMMPSFSSTLTEVEILALKDYLRELCKCVGK